MGHSLYMKKMTLIALGLLMASVPAMADIPMPPAPSDDVATVEVDGQDAADLAEGLTAKWQLESSLRTYSSSVKVLYSQDGTLQIVCKSHRMPNDGTTKTCKIERSTNGQPLKKYIVRLRMG